MRYYDVLNLVDGCELKSFLENRPCTNRKLACGTVRILEIALSYFLEILLRMHIRSYFLPHRQYTVFHLLRPGSLKFLQQGDTEQEK